MVGQSGNEQVSNFLPPLIAVAMITLGSYLVAVLLDQVGSPGYVSIWALGALSAYGVNRLVAAPASYVRGLLLVACLLTFVLATVIWIRWSIVGVTSYADAFSKFPTFLKEYRRDAFIGAILTGFGAHSAYTGVRQTKR